MTGSVFQRNPGPGRPWTIKYEGPRDPASGKRRQRWKGGFATKKEAERGLRQALAAMDRGDFIAPTNQTLGDFLLEWLDARALNLRPSTLQGYESKIRGTVIPRIGHVRLQAVDGSSLSRFYADCLGGVGLRRPLSTATVRQLHAILGRALRDAERWGRVPKNAARSADAPRVAGRSITPHRVWSADEALAFGEALGEDPLRVIYDIALRTGLRRGEILGLTWPDVDFAAKTIRVRQQVTTDHGRPVITEPKTARSRRCIEVSDDLLASLMRHRRDQAAARLRAGSQWQDCNLIVCTDSGAPVDPNRVSKWFRRRINTTGARPITFHDLRHTHATLLFQAGTSPKVVSERLGHSTVAFTLDTYVHVVPAMDRRAADDLEKLFESQAG